MAKKTELMAVEPKDLQIIEYRGLRVVTTEQLAAGYGATEKMISNNFSRNQNRFIEGKHYFDVEGEELQSLKNLPSLRGVVDKRTPRLRLWTERGAANHAKMLETDQAWSYYDEMVEFYFTRRDVLPAPADLSKLEILQLAIESEKGRLAEKERADHAERTKSQISRKREASALGKLSAANRKCRNLEERLGESVKHATITKVEKKTGGEFKFAALRKWCKERGVTAVDVPDPRYGSVKSWPAGAWLDVYGVDLRKIFGGEA
ncbi:ORF6N domain-containing protein [Serratia marcescens]|uniref:ORF6N domain-containing protein n=1 Tax=Serratia sp. TSA_105.2 TaxID=3415660 RepID=UPI0029386F25|nr:ORF6N domain-containing protein [Serratia marcescens]ELQ9437726.1 ORF6N domain-containing protein [Serratia marcescens]ELT5558063.1 ORF6N domain-containing protein [Serratia marcescens]